MTRLDNGRNPGRPRFRSGPSPEDTGFPPLLLLHGGGADGGIWDLVVARLPGFLHVVVLDLPGHGQSPGFQYNAQVVPRLAERIAEQVRELGLVQPHVVGHSLGGAVALELARHVPVSAVTVFCPIGFWTRPHAWYTALRQRNVARLAKALHPAFRSRLLCRPAIRWLALVEFSARPSAIPVDTAINAAAALAGSDLVAMSRHTWRYAFDHPEAITAPAMLAWGTRDRLVPLDDAVRARRLFPQAMHAMIPGSGHLVMQDDPDTTAAIIYARHDQVARDLRRRPPNGGPPQA
jgi:pimeloyl-ACP methyl ester carboxylesterase